MDIFVFAAVLFAALCHAGWNALIKFGLDTLSTATLLVLGSGVVGLALIPVFGIPAAASWPWLAASTFIHLFYNAALIEGYRAGDLGQVYPIARGSAPLLTATVATIYIGEKLSAQGWIGVVALVAGVFLLSLRGGRDLAGIETRAIGFALLTALTICAYSIVDGVGGRLSENPNAYTACLFTGTALIMIPYALARGGTRVFRGMGDYWKRGLVGGGMQTLSYGIAIWAMSVAPIAIVAALRETSVLFGALLAVVWLKEPLHANRVLAAGLILTGLVLIRLA